MPVFPADLTQLFRRHMFSLLRRKLATVLHVSYESQSISLYNGYQLCVSHNPSINSSQDLPSCSN